MAKQERGGALMTEGVALFWPHPYDQDLSTYNESSTPTVSSHCPTSLTREISAAFPLHTIAQQAVKRNI